MAMAAILCQIDLTETLFLSMSFPRVSLLDDELAHKAYS